MRKDFLEDDSGMDNLICYPLRTDKSVYFEVIVNAISHDKKYELVSLKEALHDRRKLKSSKIAFFSFYEDIKSSSKFKVYAKFIQHIFVIKYLKAHGVKIVHTVHNGVSHDLNCRAIESKLAKFLLTEADRVIMLCDETLSVVKKNYNLDISGKAVKIPHPNYIGIYGNEVKEDIRAKFHISPNDMVVLFLGLVRPYKNIELIIQLARDYKGKDVKFLIAGEAYDPEYMKKIRKLASGLDNVIITGEFVENDNMASYLSAADVMILPYENTSLNSGPIFIGPSFKTNVICPDIGSAKEFPDGYLYMYSYEKKVEHYKKLKGAMDTAVNEFFYHKQVFDGKRNALYEFVIGYNSEAILKEKYAMLIVKLA